MNTIRGDLGRLEATFAAGRLINEGFSLAIVGRPNVGKSSLFNALLKEERAIVAELPGTTRDLVAETAQLGGIPVRLMDTAGIREVTDRVEQLGVDRSREALADAEQVLLVLDGSEELQTEDGNLLEELEGRSYHLVINKIDLPQRLTPDTLKTSARTLSLISVRTGEGVEALRATLLRDLELEQAMEREEGLLTNLRQEQEVRSSLESLDRVKQGLAENLPHEILLLDLYRALKSLNALTGETTVEDILDHIFSKFCIGK
jgi:tRNA modification GTPase